MQRWHGRSATAKGQQLPSMNFAGLDRPVSRDTSLISQPPFGSFHAQAAIVSVSHAFVTGGLRISQEPQRTSSTTPCGPCIDQRERSSGRTPGSTNQMRRNVGRFWLRSRMLNMLPSPGIVRCRAGVSDGGPLSLASRSWFREAARGEDQTPLRRRHAKTLAVLNDSEVLA